jgi:hypothetical protein
MSGGSDDRWPDPEWATDPAERIQELEAEVERLRRGLPARLTVADADRTPLLVHQLVLRPGFGFEWAAGPEDLFLLQRARVIRVEVPGDPAR